MDAVNEIITRIGAETPQEKAAWRKIIEGSTEVVFCQLKRRVAQRPSFYRTNEESLKKRIRENLVTNMLHITDAVGKMREALDYPGVG